MTTEELKNNYFLGIVEDNNDPDKKQRVRIRIPYIHGNNDDIPTDSLPWARPLRSVDGKSYSVPEINKVVSVIFPNGSPYMPQYMESLHLDLNLQKKIEEYDSSDLVEFKALCYDYNTQIFKDSEKLSIGYKFNSLDIHEDAMIFNFKDQNTLLKIGDDKAEEGMILGTSFFEWFNEFLQTLGNGFIGNSGAPIVMNPILMQKVLEFQSLYQTKFLSQNMYLSKNFKIKSKDVSVETQTGDSFDMTNVEKELNVEALESAPKKEVDFLPLPEGVNKNEIEEAGFYTVVGRVGNEDIYQRVSGISDEELKKPEKLISLSQVDVPPVTELDIPMEKPQIDLPRVEEAGMIETDNPANEYSNDESIYSEESPDELEYYTAQDIEDMFGTVGFGDYQDDTELNTLYLNSSIYEPRYEQTSMASVNKLDKVNFEPPIKIEANKNTKMFVARIEKYLRKNNYAVFNNPGALNIVGMRNNVKESGKITNKFDDNLYVWYYDENKKLYYYHYIITTTPGFMKGKNFLPDGPRNSKNEELGVAMMLNGQYKYSLGYHAPTKNGDTHPCLRDAQTKYVRHLPYSDRYLTLKEIEGKYKDRVHVGTVGLNIHASNRSNGQAINVNNWSHGCQVFKKGADWKEFISLCSQQQNKYNIKSFYYTLVSEKDFSKK